MTTVSQRTWMITGANRGLGLAFTQAALGAGDRVAATVRSTDSLDDLKTEHGDQLLVLRLDVRHRMDVESAVDQAIKHFGSLDVVVNNAGYGLVGAVEEVSETEAREIVDTDFLGPLWVTKAVLPHMRERGSGHIVQISTTGAVGTMPTFGMYNASKAALEAFSEALAAEVAGFGIQVTIAELGGYDTDWAGSSMKFASPVAEYDELRTSLFGTPVVPWEAPDDAAEDSATGGAEPEDAAKALLAHLDADDGPLRLMIGDDVPEHLALALAARRADYERDSRFAWP